jgi:hypothetical protein
MVQVARLAPKLLGSSTELVVDFFNSQRGSDGGFCDRQGISDLYYTVFGIEGLMALQQPLPTDDLHRYVRSFGEGADLDFVHVACLARCWSALPGSLSSDCPRDVLLARIESCRTPDGGYGVVPKSDTGSLYGAFVAVQAYQDLGCPIPDVDRLLEFVDSLRDSGGGFSQSRDLPVSLVPATAGAVALLRHLGGQAVDPRVGEWILSCFDPQGGFRPAPTAFVPDLLSTATALHSLAAMKVDLGERTDLCTDFIDTLWTNRGGFYGHWEDSHVDCEYSYYGLLALGHLSL